MPKASTGCLECRRRRIKCDGRPGSGGCANCQGHGVACSGVSTQIDSILRDETSKVASRFVVIDEKPKSRAEEESGQQAGPSRQRRSPPSIPESPRVILDIDLLAIESFYSTYCLRGYPRKSADDFKRIGNGSLFAAIKAIGLEGMQQDPSPQVMHQYNEAIGLLNGALASQKTSKDDSTLLATIVLSALELKAAPQLTLDDYFNHIQGACALLELRGPQQVLSQLGSALYNQVSSQVFLSCIFGCHKLPQQLWLLREQIAPYVMNAALTCWREQGVVMRFVDFRFAAEIALGQDVMATTDAFRIVTEALHIYVDLCSVFEDAPQMWQFRLVRGTDQAEVETEHRFQLYIAAQSWAAFRVISIKIFDIVARIVRRCDNQKDLLESITNDQRLYVTNAHHITRQAGLALLASAPQQVDYLRSRLANRKPELSLAPESFERTQIFHCDNFVHGSLEVDQELPYVIFPAGINIFQAMFLAANTDSVESDLKQQLTSALTLIADNTGIRQASQLARILTVTPVT